ncbi:sensor histidine kinase [Microlunatus sp. GCM10028923]|uniref:sensor histidine kinase n=1 Tax=Microlunatus sp. GCM10028923 TaxID=3273400 RepID=UPI0036076C14
MGYDDADRPVRRARAVALVALLAAPASTAIMPGLALARDPGPGRAIPGAIGIALVTVALAAALYRSLMQDEVAAGGAVRPAPTDVALWLALLASIPLAAPLGGADWSTWAWLGGSVGGALPLIYRRPVVLIGGWLALLVAVLAVGSWVGDPLGYGLTAISVGGTVAFMCGLPYALWRLVGELRAGREARARLAVAEERLRFARDIHDLVGHSLSVIALKAELVERLQPNDPGRAAAEAGQLRGLTADALVQLRSTVDGYRGIDLDQQAVAVGEALASAGIPYRMELAARPDSAAVSRLLAIALREASTNVLRHGRGTECVITLDRAGRDLRLRVVNDAAEFPAESGRAGTGLAGMRERFAEFGGSVRAGRDGERFVFEATVPCQTGPS